MKQSIKDKILSETSKETKQRVRETANKLVIKQETLKEVSERLYPIIETNDYMDWYDKNYDIRNSFINGAKWQQERSYSKEDLKDAFQSGFTNGFNINSVTFEEWFEQFKKK